MSQKHTSGPWAWCFIGDKTNGYIVGTFFDKNNKQLSGQLTDDDIWLDEGASPGDYCDELLIESNEIVGDHEVATCNYANAHLIAAAPDLLKALREIRDAVTWGIGSQIYETAQAAIIKAEPSS